MQYCTIAIIQGVTGHHHLKLTLLLPAITHAITGCFLLFLLQVKSQREHYTKRVPKTTHAVSCSHTIVIILFTYYYLICVAAKRSSNASQRSPVTAE